MLKVVIKGLIFKLGFAPIFERFNFLREKVKNKEINNAFLKKNPNIILPPDFYIYETFTLNYEKYFHGGYETAKWIYSHLSEFKDLKKVSILDWGCGPARVIRHLPSIIKEKNKYFGCDYNEKYINWCKENINSVIFKKNKLAPPLDFLENSFNVIYGISIFTHLSAKMHSEWMLELNRVLKKGGLVFLTTHGSVTKQKLSNEDQNLFDKGNLVVHHYKKEGNRLFATYQPYDFFKSLCETSNFKVLKHIPGEVKNNKPLQDVWIISKV